jgi:glutamate 5-kinase
MSRGRRFVVKIGSRVLLNGASPSRGIDARRIDALCGEVAELALAGYEPVIVTSGAIACGIGRLQLPGRPKELPRLQAAAAAGQIALIRIYEESLSKRNLIAAQLLLTHSDVADRRRYLNARATLRELIGLGTIPVINENDTVATREIRFGDNDALSAEVAALAGADLLVLLTDVPCLMDGDPQAKGPDGGPGASRRIAVVRDIAREATPFAGQGDGRVGTGGMVSKIEAARRASDAGIPTIIADGRRADILSAIFSGEDTGTLFVPKEAPLKARKAWIANTLKPSGRIVVDSGAEEALVERGKSLLPSGIRAVEGAFVRGAPVAIVDEGGVEFARGLVSYDSTDLAKIAGLKSDEVPRVLGFAYDEAVHRDDLVLLARPAAGNGPR